MGSAQWQTTGRRPLPTGHPPNTPPPSHNVHYSPRYPLDYPFQEPCDKKEREGRVEEVITVPVTAPRLQEVLCSSFATRFNRDCTQGGDPQCLRCTECVASLPAVPPLCTRCRGKPRLTRASTDGDGRTSGQFQVAGEHPSRGRLAGVFLHQVAQAPFFHSFI
jgi:hypothetical protein